MIVSGLIGPYNYKKGPAGRQLSLFGKVAVLVGYFILGEEA